MLDAGRDPALIRGAARRATRAHARRGAPARPPGAPRLDPPGGRDPTLVTTAAGGAE
jgi:hypothetical protein